MISMRTPTVTLTGRGRSAAQTGAATLSAGSTWGAHIPAKDVFVGVPSYVADLEIRLPRGACP